MPLSCTKLIDKHWGIKDEGLSSPKQTDSSCCGEIMSEETQYEATSGGWPFSYSRDHLFPQASWHSESFWSAAASSHGQTRVSLFTSESQNILQRSQKIIRLRGSIMILNSPGTRIGVKHVPVSVSGVSQAVRGPGTSRCEGHPTCAAIVLTSRHGVTSHFKQKEPLKTTGVNDAKDSKCADLEMALAASGNHALCTRQMTDHFELKKKTPMAWHTPAWKVYGWCVPS